MCCVSLGLLRRPPALRKLYGGLSDVLRSVARFQVVGRSTRCLNWHGRQAGRALCHGRFEEPRAARDTVVCS